MCVCVCILYWFDYDKESVRWQATERARDVCNNVRLVLGRELRLFGLLVRC